MSFLLDEFARPPSPKPLIFDSKEHSPLSDDNEELTVKKIRNNTSDNQQQQSTQNVQQNKISQEEESKERQNNFKIQNSSFATEQLTNLQNKKLIERKSEEKLITIEDVKDFTDPLRAPELSPTKLSDTESLIVEFAVQMPYDNRFRTALSSTVLSVSPFVSFPLPYLETEQGRKCPLRSLFPIELYFSKQWSTITTNTIGNMNDNCEKDNKGQNGNNFVNLKPSHEFVKHKITDPIDSLELQTLLAEFRANGGRYPKTNKSKLSFYLLEEILQFFFLFFFFYL